MRVLVVAASPSPDIPGYPLPLPHIPQYGLAVVSSYFLLFGDIPPYPNTPPPLYPRIGRITHPIPQMAQNQLICI
jgi:hypothetical protein